MKNSFEQYTDHNRKIALLSNVTSILDIDNIIHLPEEAGDIRSEQAWVLWEIIHSLLTDIKYAELCIKLKDEERNEIRRKNIKISVKEILKNQKLPWEFVKEQSGLLSTSQNIYYKAREKNDFSMFVPYLEQVVASMRKKAEYLGIKWTYYNTLLDEYDEWLTEDILDPVFAQIKAELLPIVKKIYALKREWKTFSVNTQDEKVNTAMFEEILTEIWYNLKRWKIITCPSSFMIDGNPMDARMMIRNSGKILDMLWSVIHEWWHWIYEQSFNPDFLWLPMSQSTSYTMHESQSRLYELNLGNSREYLSRILAFLKKYYPEETKDVTLDELYFIANKVSPTKRRVEWDEISYHIHIMIRYEIERDLANGNIEVKDIKEIWNSKYREYLWIEFDNEWEWILQDIHWSCGNFWYFPTYSVGTFYAAQFFAQMEEEIPDLKSKISEWKLEEIKNWLNKNVHSHWKLKTSVEILRYSTKKDLDINIYIRYIKEKYSSLYWIEL